MHILYVHPSFPAQLGHIARLVAGKPGWRATFVSQSPAGVVDGIERIQFAPAGGATSENHFCSRTFENAVWNCDAVYHALRARPDIRPDLIVGHSGFGSTLFLRELYGSTPILNLFEYFYAIDAPDNDMTFRSDLNWPLDDQQFHRARCRNAMILLDLHNADGGYIPTSFQLSRFPLEYRPKLKVIFDGIDRTVYHGHEDSLRLPIDRRGTRQIAGVSVPASTRVVTYVSRGFESLRGFDIFLRASKLIARQFPDVLFFVVGSDRICYGGDASHVGPFADFKQWAIAREEPDLSRMIFTGMIDPHHLARLLAITDLHIYLTAPFVLSWSMMNAMSCGAVVLGSATAPVQEMIEHGKTGLLADFFDADSIATQAVNVLKDLDAHRPLGRAAEQLIRDSYSLEAILPRMLKLYEDAGHVTI